jgi:hypothetical protein
MVTLQEAKSHLRVDHTDEDVLIQAYLNAAHKAVEDYTGVVFDPMPSPVWAAVLLLTADLYANRERSSERPLHESNTFKALLNPYRQMDLA